MLILKWEMKVFEREVEEILGKDLPFAMAQALTWTAGAVRADSYREMRDVFDRPKGWTVPTTFGYPPSIGSGSVARGRAGSISINPARKRDFPDQSADVFFKDQLPNAVPAGRYLQPLVRGSKRSHKSFEMILIRRGVIRPGEYLVPGKQMPLDQNGNVKRAVIKDMLSALGAGDQDTKVSGARPTKTARVRKTWFAVAGGGGQLKAIMYRSGSKQPIVAFVVVGAGSQPKYGKEFMFREKARASAERHMPRAFVDATKAILLERRERRMR